MNDLLLVHVVDSPKDLPQYVGRLDLGELLLLDEPVKQLSSLEKLGGYVKVLVVFQDLIDRHDVGMSRLLQDDKFRNHQLREH